MISLTIIVHNTYTIQLNTKFEGSPLPVFPGLATGFFDAFSLLAACFDGSVFMGIYPFSVREQRREHRAAS